MRWPCGNMPGRVHDGGTPQLNGTDRTPIRTGTHSTGICFEKRLSGRQTTQQLDIYGTAEAYKGPVRIIHGEEDSLVPMWCSEDYKKIYGENAELIVVEGENHRISRKTKKVAEMVATFFVNIF